MELTGKNWQLLCGDCLEMLQSLPRGVAAMSLGSPPYEDARTYGIGFKLAGQSWVDWMIPRVAEMCRVTDGLVFINAAGKRKDWKYSPIMEWLVADLTRHHGIVCGPAPYVFHRVGIPGSGSRKYHRRDWEPVYAFARPECVPPKWTDNTAMGHPPKWAPGGAMSNRHADGRRINAMISGNNPRRIAAGKNQWGHPLNSGATVVDDGSVVRSKGKRPSHRKAGKIDGMIESDGPEPKVAEALENGLKAGSKLHTKNNGHGMRVQCYDEPVLADPGNVIFCKVGGGQMGSRLAHENEAPFPEKLAEFFIRSFCPPGGIVLDPFVGSGTTVAVAKRTGRHGIGIDIRESQLEIVRRRLREVQPELMKD